MSLRVYKLTKLGKEIIRNGSGDPEDIKILDHLWNVKTATEDELSIVGETWRIRRMVPKLIKEV